jgi:hypothetical protein
MPKHGTLQITAFDQKKPSACFTIQSGPGAIQLRAVFLHFIHGTVLAHCKTMLFSLTPAPPEGPLRE